MAQRKPAWKRRSGTTSVEFALVAPVVLTLFFGLVEMMTCNTAMHAMNHAAYEGARTGMLPGSTVSKCEDKARHLVQRLGYDQVNVSVSPSNLSNADEVTVTVTLSANEVGLATGFFVKKNQLSQTVTLRKINQ